MAGSRRYCAYMLRGWLEAAGDDGQGTWRFRLRNVQTGEERAFASLEAVAAFLAQAFAQEDEDS